MSSVINIVVTVIIGIAATMGTGWLGLQVQPKPFSAYPEQTPTLESVDLPADLPAPVARYYRTTIGDQIPVIAGRGRLRIKPIFYSCKFEVAF